jgi:predicted DNA-binding protein
VAATLSVRLSDDVRARLRARAEQTSERPTALAQRLIEEGLRREVHPGITFKNKTRGGRIAALIAGPDVVEVMSVLRDLEATGDEAVAEAARWLTLTTTQVGHALRYYIEYRNEVDAELARRDAVSIRVEEELKQRQRLLS